MIFLSLIVDGKLVLLIKSFETFDSFFEEDPIHHRSVLLVVCFEVGDVLDQSLDIFFRVFRYWVCSTAKPLLIFSD